MQARDFLSVAAVLFLTILAAPSAVLFGQTSFGSVNGIISDPTAARVPGATVTLVNQATGIQTQRLTNDNGYFTFVNVRPGAYTLSVELPDFKTAHVAPFTVGVSTRLSFKT
ncbi:MAG: carboxypeptidase-like regulatory domain-containing protein [Acidobacteriota bacterium]